MLSEDLLTMDNSLRVIQGEFELNRLPKRPLELLRAWDAADEYLLNTLTDELKPLNNTRLLIFNDSFGALAVALHECRPQAVQIHIFPSKQHALICSQMAYLKIVLH